MEPTPDTPFDLHSVISRIITEQATHNDRMKTIGIGKEDETIFQRLVRELIAYRKRDAKTMTQLKARDKNTKHGKDWEIFCREWLRTDITSIRGEYINRYINV